MANLKPNAIRDWANADSLARENRRLLDSLGLTYLHLRKAADSQEAEGYVYGARNLRRRLRLVARVMTACERRQVRRDRIQSGARPGLLSLRNSDRS